LNLNNRLFYHTMKNAPGITNHYKTKRVDSKSKLVNKLNRLLNNSAVNTNVIMIRGGVMIDKLKGAETSYDKINILHDSVIHANVQLILEAIYDTKLDGQSYALLGIEPVTQGFQIDNISQEYIDYVIDERLRSYLKIIYKYAKENKIDPKSVIKNFVAQVCLGVSIRVLLDGSDILKEIEMVKNSLKSNQLNGDLEWGDEIDIRTSYLPVDRNRLPSKEDVAKMQQSIMARVDFESLFKINCFFL
jgi:hypothetical protein